MLLEVGKQRLLKLKATQYELSRIGLWAVVDYDPRAIVAGRLERPVLDETFGIGWITLHEVTHED